MRLYAPMPLRITIGRAMTAHDTKETTSELWSIITDAKFRRGIIPTLISLLFLKASFMVMINFERDNCVVVANANINIFCFPIPFSEIIVPSNLEYVLACQG